MERAMNTRTVLPLMLILIGLTAAPTGCSDEPNALCSASRPCPPGSRCADGVCTEVRVRDTGSEDTRPVADGGGLDEGLLGDGPDGAPDGARADGASLCQGNADDRVDRSELPIAVGAEVTYSRGNNLLVDLEGEVVNDRRRWELLESAEDEATVVSQLLPVFAWAQPDFPQATYVSLLDADLDTYGVFLAGDDALRIQGIVSEAEDETVLTYSSPVDMLRFPIAPGDAFVTEAGLTGTLSWVPVWLHESYAVQVLGAGELALPEITFGVVLVRIDVSQYPVANPLWVTRRALFLFVAECYGIVARVVVDGVVGDALSAVEADERWRLAF